MFVFRKIWRALFSTNVCFEIRPFALLSTKYKQIFQRNLKKLKSCNSQNPQLVY